MMRVSLTEWKVELENTWLDSLSPFQLLLLTLVVISTLMAVFLVVSVFLLMLVRNRKKRWADALQARIEDGITIWLAGDYSIQELIITFQQEIKKDPRAIKIILNVIFATSKLFRQEGQSALRQLLTGLNLHQLCYKLLKNWHWYQQAYAIQIIGQLQLEHALPLLKRKLKTKNRTLRLELITAMFALGGQSWLQEMDYTTAHLSEWEQIVLLERFRRLNIDQLPPFETWLTSTHTGWVLFGIRLCRHFNRFDQVLELGNLLTHPDKKVQMAVLDAFDYLGSPEIVPFLIKYMPQATGDRLRTTLRVLGNQGDPDLVRFLIPYTEHPDLSIQVSALSALKEMGLTKIELRQLSSNPQYIDHMFDPKRP
jgi:DNA segregation ATPase FtsK/SpoIIIE-like protein